jgi:hypothetical protein
MKRIFSLVLAIFLIGIVSAVYPGETISVNNTFQSLDLQYMIIGNSTPVELIFNITLNEINITFPANLAPDTFTILLIKNSTQQIIEVQVPYEVTHEVYTGGGGGIIYRNNTINNTIYVPQNTTCNESGNIPIETKSKISFWWMGVVIIFSFGIISLVRWLFRRNQRIISTQNPIEEDTEEKGGYN